jgi:hypothetical protein
MSLCHCRRRLCEKSPSPKSTRSPKKAYRCSKINDLIPVRRIVRKALRHEGLFRWSKACHLGQITAAADATSNSRCIMWMVAIGPQRYWDRVSTAPVCEACTTPEEHEAAAGVSWAACLGCRRLMAPAVSNFRRSTCSPACQMRVERRRLPPPPPLPSKVCAQCQRRFIPGRRGTGKIKVAPTEPKWQPYPTSFGKPRQPC